MNALLVGALLAAQGPFRLPGSPVGAAWGFLYGVDAKPEIYMPELRKLGGGFTKVYLFWHQIEPEKGRFEWSAVDAFTKQLRSPDEGLVSVFSVSTWATQRTAASLPPSPAKNLDDYYRFVYTLVKHCHGRVRYWQNDSEPNNPVYWAGTKEQFLDGLKTFYRAVKSADPRAIVVAGGYDGLFNPPTLPPKPNQKIGLDFFDYVIKEGRDAFDVFDLRLYAEPYTIPERVEIFRQKLLAAGKAKPMVATEYGGPGLFEFPVNRKYASLAVAWATSIAQTGTGGKFAPIEELYAKMPTLAPELQMFMRDAPPALAAKYERIQARSLVMRNLFAFSSGVQKTLYWQFSQTKAERADLMDLMYGKIGMMAPVDGRHTRRLPIAEVFSRMAHRLADLRSVRRIVLADRPTIFLFEVERAHRRPMLVAWERRDAFSGEDSPAVPFDAPWMGRSAKAIDLFGSPVPTKVAAGRVSFDLSVDPIYVEE